MHKFPSSIWCWDSNSQPSERESPPITTRPGLPTILTHSLNLVNELIYCTPAAVVPLIPHQCFNLQSQPALLATATWANCLTGEPASEVQHPLFRHPPILALIRLRISWEVLGSRQRRTRQTGSEETLGYLFDLIKYSVAAILIKVINNDSRDIPD